MTVENLWINNQIIKAVNHEKFDKNYDYSQDSYNDEHFATIRRCAVMNSTAVFTDALPEKVLDQLEKVKERHPKKYEKELEKAQKEWSETLSNMKSYKRKVVGDASETALVKFF